jgi:hypothetical protein
MPNLLTFCEVVQNGAKFVSLADNGNFQAEKKEALRLPV